MSEGTDRAATDRVPTVRALTRRYALLAGLRWLPIGLCAPVIVLLQGARGLDLATTGRLLALYGVVTVLLELPTGGLADVVGRRVVLVLASVLTAAFLLVMAVAGDPAWFAVAMVLGAVGRALGSGPLEAWYVDAVHDVEPGLSVRGGLSAAQSAEAMMLGVGAIAGGGLPGVAAGLWPGLQSSGGAPLVTLSIPLIGAAALALAHAAAVALLVREAARTRVGAFEVVRDVPRTVRDGIRIAVGDDVLRRLTLRSLLLGLALGGMELLSPGTFAGLLGGAEQGSGAFGLLVALGFGATAAGAAYAPRIAGRLGGGARAAGLISWLGVPAAAIVAGPSAVAAGLGYITVYLMVGTVGPLTSELLHGRVEADRRSTIVSVESLALQLGGVGASLGLGALATAASPTAGFLVIAAALGVSGCVLIGRTNGRASLPSG